MIDPSPFAAFGVVGGLLFVCGVLVLLIRNILESNAKRFESRDQVLMDFVSDHRKDFTVSLDNMSNKIVESHAKFSDTMERHTRRLDEFLLTSEVLRRLEQAKRRGESLDDTTIEKVIRGAKDDRSGRNG